MWCRSLNIDIGIIQYFFPGGCCLVGLVGFGPLLGGLSWSLVHGGLGAGGRSCLGWLAPWLEGLPLWPPAGSPSGWTSWPWSSKWPQVIPALWRLWCAVVFWIPACHCGWYSIVAAFYFHARFCNKLSFSLSHTHKCTLTHTKTRTIRFLCMHCVLVFLYAVFPWLCLLLFFLLVSLRFLFFVFLALHPYILHFTQYYILYISHVLFCECPVHNIMSTLCATNAT